MEGELGSSAEILPPPNDPWKNDRQVGDRTSKTGANRYAFGIADWSSNHLWGPILWRFSTIQELVFQLYRLLP